MEGDAPRTGAAVCRFLAGGGDNFSVLKQGRDPRTGMMDVDAFEQFVKSSSLIAPGVPNRITRLN